MWKAAARAVEQRERAWSGVRWRKRVRLATASGGVREEPAKRGLWGRRTMRSLPTVRVWGPRE